MSEPTRAAEVAKEAVCSALYGMEFSRFLGEQPDVVTGWPSAYFLLSRNPAEKVSARVDPKQVMVTVGCDTEEIVFVKATWLNFSGPEVIRGDQTMRIVADPDQEPALKQAVEDAVVRVLNIYAEVLSETGVAGPLEKVAPESEAGDPDDPADLARTDEEVETDRKEA